MWRRIYIKDNGTVGYVTDRYSGRAGVEETQEAIERFRTEDPALVSTPTRLITRRPGSNQLNICWKED